MQFFQTIAHKNNQFSITYPDGSHGKKTARYEVGMIKGKYRDMFAVIADTSGFDGLGFDKTIGSDDDNWHTVNLFNKNHRYIDTVAVAGADDIDHAVFVALSQFDYLEPDYGVLVPNDNDYGFDSLGFSADTIQKLLDNPSQNQHFLPIITKKMLVHEQNQACYDNVMWSGIQLISHGRDIHQLYRDMLKHDTFGELTEKIDLKQVLGQFDGIAELGFDSLMEVSSRLQAMTDKLHRALLNASTENLKVVEFSLSKPFKHKGEANVAMKFLLSDGQSFSIFFKNPDDDPAKIGANDVMVSWKWLLNKKDITAVVQPENGKNIQLSQVAMRMMKLATANMGRFASAQAQKAKNEQEILDVQQAVAEKQELLETLDKEIADLQAQIDAKRHEHKQAFDDDVGDQTENQTVENNTSHQFKFELGQAYIDFTFGAEAWLVVGRRLDIDIRGNATEEYVAINRAGMTNFGKEGTPERIGVDRKTGLAYQTKLKPITLDEDIKLSLYKLFNAEHMAKIYNEDKTNLEQQGYEFLSLDEFLKLLQVGENQDKAQHDDIDYDKSKFTLVNSIGNWFLTLKEDKNFVGVLNTEDSYDEGLQAYGVSINMPEDGIKKLYKLGKFKDFIEYNSVDGTYEKDYVSEFAFGLQNAVNELSKVILEMFNEVNNSKQLAAKYPIYEQIQELLDKADSEDYSDSDVAVDGELAIENDDDYDKILHNRTYGFIRGLKSVFDICQSQGFEIVVGDFNYTLSKGLFDSLSNKDNVVVQIGKGDKIARCAIDDDGRITVLIGASGDKGFKAVKYDKESLIKDYLEQAFQESGLMAGVVEDESIAGEQTQGYEYRPHGKDLTFLGKEFDHAPTGDTYTVWGLDEQSIKLGLQANSVVVATVNMGKPITTMELAEKVAQVMQDEFGVMNVEIRSDKVMLQGGAGAIKNAFGSGGLMQKKSSQAIVEGADIGKESTQQDTQLTIESAEKIIKSLVQQKDFFTYNFDVLSNGRNNISVSLSKNILNGYKDTSRVPELSFGFFGEDVSVGFGVSLRNDDAFDLGFNQFKSSSVNIDDFNKIVANALDVYSQLWRDYWTKTNNSELGHIFDFVNGSKSKVDDVVVTKKDTSFYLNNNGKKIIIRQNTNAKTVKVFVDGREVMSFNVLKASAFEKGVDFLNIMLQSVVDTQLAEQQAEQKSESMQYKVRGNENKSNNEQKENEVKPLSPLPISFDLHKEFERIVDNGDGYVLAELTEDDEFLKNYDFKKQLPFAEQRKVKAGTYILKTFPFLAQGVDDDKHKYTFAGALSTAKKLVKEFKNSNIFNNPHKGKTWQGLKGFGRIIVSEFSNSYYAYYEPTKEMVFIKGDVDEYIANDNPEAQLAKEQAEQEQTRLAEIQKAEQEAERQAKIDELERQLQEQKILAEQQQEILGQKAELIEDEVMPAFKDVKLYDKRGNKFEAVMRLAEQSQNAKQLGFENNKGLIEHLAKQGYEFVKENEYSDDYVPMEYRSKFERSGGNYGSITSHYFAKLDDKSYEISEAEYHYGWHILGKIRRGELAMNEPQNPNYTQSDIDYLQSIINGTLDLETLDMDKMIEIGEKDENDPLFQQADEILAQHQKQVVIKALGE